MYILGLNCYGHDSSATLIDDEHIILAVEEERLNRKKHSGEFPRHSVGLALEKANISLDDIDYVTFSWNPWITYSKIPIYISRYWKTLPTLLKERKSFSMEDNLGMINYLSEIRKIPKKLQAQFDSSNCRFRYHMLNHHMCHAASCYYTTDFDDAAILTIDGAGEWATTMLAAGQGNTITKLLEVETPFSYCR